MMQNFKRQKIRFYFVVSIFLMVIRPSFMNTANLLESVLKLPQIPAKLPPIPSKLPPIPAKLPLVITPPQETSSDLEIMDFYVPSHPFEGDTFEISCGFKIIDGMKLHQIEWHRVTENNHRFLFFRLSGDGQGVVYGHDWLRRGNISYYHLNNTTGIQSLRLVIHQVDQNLSGKLECQIILESGSEEEVTLVVASRSQEVKVVDVDNMENGDDTISISDGNKLSQVVYELVVRFEKVLNCHAEGAPAPHLSWWTIIDDSDDMEMVTEDKVETMHLDVSMNSGIQLATESLLSLEAGHFACVADYRNGLKQIMRIEVLENLTWFHVETTIDGSDDEEINFCVTQEIFILISVLVCSFILVLLLYIICSSIKRSRNKRRRHFYMTVHTNSIGHSQNNNSSNQNKNSLKARSLKRKAPIPKMDNKTDTRGL